MRIKLHTNVRADKGYCLKGSIVDFDEKDAKSLISRGFAEEVKEPKKATVTPAKSVEEPKAEPKAEEKKVEAPKKAETKAPAKKAAPKVAKATASKKEAAKKATAKKA